MYNFSDEAKNRIKNGGITRAYLKVLATETKPEFIINESNYLKDITLEDLRYVPDQGFIGQAVAKRITGNFNNVDENFTIQDREFELYLGVDLKNGSTEYTKYGTYIVQKPNDNKINDNTSFEALDYMCKLNQEWVDNLTYPCTLKDIWIDLIKQTGIKTKTIDFPNSDFIVENNQFEVGTTQRDVAKAIAQIAFNWVRIDENDNIVMDFQQKDTIDEEITIDEYFDLNTQEKYGPVNTIILRNSQIEGENITIRDEKNVKVNGEISLVISDNPFAYTQEKRVQLIEAGRRLFGLSYTPMSMEMIGFMYLNCVDKIRTNLLNNNKIDTYLLNHTIQYNGIISDNMEAPAMTKTETKYQFTSDLIKKQTQTEIIVDKQSQSINGIVSQIGDRSQKETSITADIDGLNNKISSLQDITDEIEGIKTITLRNCIEGALLELHIYGNNTVFDALYASENTIANDNLIMYGDSAIIVNSIEYELGIPSVLKQSGTNYDEYILSEGKATIKRINGTVENLGEYSIPLKKGTNTIKIKNYSAKIKAKFAIQNDYTDLFATKVEMTSSIKQTAEEINFKVQKKVDENKIISKINQTSEKISIEANKISLSGKTLNLSDNMAIVSNNFNVDSKGNMTCNNADCENINIRSGSLKMMIDDTTIQNFELVTSDENYVSSFLGWGLNINGYMNGRWTRGIVQLGASTNGAGGFVDCEGNMSAYAFNQTSLESKKKNIEISKQNALDIINNSEIYNFNFKTENNETKKHTGFIIGDEGGKYKTPKEVLTNDEKAIDMYSMASILWKAVQEQQKQIEKLQKEIKKVKGGNE